ncbi:hypothetical protein DFJ73DRAFT_894891 [Zopfochytrium polystomum]|nr:hypothetical protein DFJ73DRAFT_894891 [Zopfochytrium polystomum]
MIDPTAVDQDVRQPEAFDETKSFNCNATISWIKPFAARADNITEDLEIFMFAQIVLELLTNKEVLEILRTKRAGEKYATWIESLFVKMIGRRKFYYLERGLVQQQRYRRSIERVAKLVIIFSLADRWCDLLERGLVNDEVNLKKLYIEGSTNIVLNEKEQKNMICQIIAFMFQMMWLRKYDMEALDKMARTPVRMEVLEVKSILTQCDFLVESLLIRLYDDENRGSGVSNGILTGMWKLSSKPEKQLKAPDAFDPTFLPNLPPRAARCSKAVEVVIPIKRKPDSSNHNKPKKAKSVLNTSLIELCDNDQDLAEALFKWLSNQRPDANKVIKWASSNDSKKLLEVIEID